MHASPETDLRARFVTRTEPFSHGAFRAEILLPRSADELIEEGTFDADERLPYWAELWPSARALARWLLDHPPTGSVIELGAGIALPSLALRHLGLDPLATDWYPEALEFARTNAERNGLGPLRTRVLDWREVPEVGRFDGVIAADVLYELRNSQALATVLPRLVAPGGRVLVADPGRNYLPGFRRKMEEAG